MPEDRFPTAQATLAALENLGHGTHAAQVQTLSQQQILDRITYTRPPGRDDEWERLLDIWQKVLSGALDAHPVVFLVGEAGSGKGEMAYRLLNKMQLSGARILTTRCFDTPTPVPYQPITEMLRDYLRDYPYEIPPTIAADIAKLVPEIAETQEIANLPSLSPEAEQSRLYEHITQLLLNRPAQQPLVLVFEYLHCTDASSLALLHYLARHISRQPIMILGTYRPSELDHVNPLNSILREFISQDLSERVILRPMNLEETHQLIRQVFGEGLDEDFSATIYETTQGNIFFTRELLKSLVSEGRLRVHDNIWQAEAIEQVELPNSIRSIVGHLLGKLSPDALEVLPLAAVIGQEFSFDLLADLAEIDEDRLVDILDEALKIRLIEEQGNFRDEIYRFSNLAIHQTLRDKLSHRRISRFHLKIAKAMERLYQRQIDDHLEAIAQHYSFGARTDEDIARAIDYLERAADRASAIFALADAIEYYTQALELSQEDFSPQREERILSLQERRGRANQQVGDFAAAAEDLREVLACEAVEDNSPRKRQVLLELGQVYRRGEEFDRAIKTLKDAVAISRQIGDERLVADALYYLGATYWSLRQNNLAMEHQTEAYAIVERMALNDDVAMRVLHGLAEAYGRYVDYEKLFTLAEQSLALARELGDVEYEAENLMIMGVAATEQGHYERAQAIFDDKFILCGHAGLRWHRNAALAGHGLAKAMNGDYAGGLDLLQQALHLSQRYFKGFLQTMVWGFLGQCYMDLGALDDADHALTQARTLAERHQISWSHALNNAHWAMVQIQFGNYEVGAMLKATMQDAMEHGSLHYIPLLYQALAELELARDNPDDALGWVDKMEKMARDFGQLPRITEAARLRGQCLIAHKRFAEAQPILENAIEIAVNLNSPRLTWRLHQTLGDIYSLTQQNDRAMHSYNRVRTIIDTLSENVSDRHLQDALKRNRPPTIRLQHGETTLRMLVLTDAFGTVIQEAIDVNLEVIRQCDLLVLLGDLPAKTYPTLREEFELTMPGLCVLGNHDDESFTSWLPRYQFNHLHQEISTVTVGTQQIRFGGFSGSEALWASSHASMAMGHRTFGTCSENFAKLRYFAHTHCPQTAAQSSQTRQNACRITCNWGLSRKTCA